MPYIDPIRRDMLNPAIQRLVYAISENPEFALRRGDVVSFAIFTLLDKIYSIASYQSYNEAIGVLSAARREFVRRRVSSYKIRCELIEARREFDWQMLNHAHSLSEAISSLASEIESTPLLADKKAGVTNYAITKLIIAFYLFPRYDEMQEAAEVVGCAADRFYDQRVAPYEDRKISECGDVYPEGAL